MLDPTGCQAIRGWRRMLVSTDELMRSSEELPEEVLDGLDADFPEDTPSRPGDRGGSARRDDAEHSVDARLWRLSRAPRARDAWTEIAARIEAEEAARRSSVWRRLPAPLRMAAMFVLALGIGVWLATYADRTAADAEWAVATAPAGMPTTVELLDGSTVRLNAGSSLSYPVSPADGVEVHLAGEAYFAVPRESTRSFVVHTEEGVVRVLGTEFNVRARDDRLQVEVVQGEVELESAGSAVVLRAGQRSEARRGAAPGPAEPLDPEMAGAWMRGVLLLEDEPVAQAAAELERRFAVRIRVDEAMALRRVTATVHAATVEDAVDAICLAVGAACQRRNATWSIADPTGGR